MSEDKLKKEFEQFGPVKRVRIVQDTVSGKPRGYAFVEFDHERDMRGTIKTGVTLLANSGCLLVYLQRPISLPMERRSRVDAL